MENTRLPTGVHVVDAQIKSLAGGATLVKRVDHINRLVASTAEALP